MGQTVVADQHMEPFADYRARYAYELENGELRFRSENLTPISYKGFASVGPGNMVWYLYGFPKDGATFLYGVGAVKTIDLLGLFSERLKTSFIGRIQAFFSYIYEKRTEERGKMNNTKEVQRTTALRPNDEGQISRADSLRHYGSAA
jgi:hypothetical protein